MKPSVVLALVGLGVLAPAAWAEHAHIDLSVKTVTPRADPILGESHASADQEPPAGGLNPRPLMRVKAKEPLSLQFILTSTYPHGEIKGMVVRYFVVRASAPRQKTVPDLREGVVTRGRFVVSLKPKGRVGARVSFTLPEPGIYLVRIDTANTNSDHEHISAIDLRAE
jgi:hypothetical protein